MRDILNLTESELSGLYADMESFIRLMESPSSITEKFEQLPSIRNFDLNNFSHKLNAAIRKEYFSILSPQTLQLQMETDPKGRTFQQLWDDIDRVSRENNLDLIISLSGKNLFQSYWSHLAIIDETADSETETRFKRYKQITNQDDQQAQERLAEVLEFYKQYLQLFLILTQQEGYPSNELAS